MLIDTCLTLKVPWSEILVHKKGGFFVFFFKWTFFDICKSPRERGKNKMN